MGYSSAAEVDVVVKGFVFAGDTIFALVQLLEAIEWHNAILREPSPREQSLKSPLGSFSVPCKHFCICFYGLPGMVSHKASNMSTDFLPSHQPPFGWRRGC